MFSGEDGAAGSDAADQRQAERLGQADAARAAFLEQDRALGGQCTQVGLGGVRRAETERGAHFGARRRTTFGFDGGADEVEDFLLACGKGFAAGAHVGLHGMAVILNSYSSRASTKTAHACTPRMPRAGAQGKAQGTSTAAPCSAPRRRRSSASLAASSAKRVTSVRTGTLGARARNSSPSRRVRLATETIRRSPHRRLYGKLGMSLMWMPAHTTVPPLSVARSAAGTSSPAGAKISAASSGGGGASSPAPTQQGPSWRANAWLSTSLSRVKAWTSRPCHAATCAMMWAAAPKP